MLRLISKVKLFLKCDGGRYIEVGREGGRQGGRKAGRHGGREEGRRY